MMDEFLGPRLSHLHSKHKYLGLSQVISIAACDLSFAAQLLTEPAAALAQMPADIQLSPEELSLITSIQGAADIYEFAALLLARIQAASMAEAKDQTLEAAAQKRRVAI